MTENGYTKEEILKGERIILQVCHCSSSVLPMADPPIFQTLNFDISSYCTPYSWVRRISKADDYDIQTRTLSKFLMEVTLLDHRFLRCKPSLIAAIGMFTARKMLDGDWVCRVVHDIPWVHTSDTILIIERRFRLLLQLHRDPTIAWSSNHD